MGKRIYTQLNINTDEGKIHLQKCNHQKQAQAVVPLITTKILSILWFPCQGLKHLLKNKKALMLQKVLFNLGSEVNPTNKIHSNRPIPKKAYRGEKMFIILFNSRY